MAGVDAEQGADGLHVVRHLVVAEEGHRSVGLSGVVQDLHVVGEHGGDAHHGGVQLLLQQGLGTGAADEHLGALGHQGPGALGGVLQGGPVDLHRGVHLTDRGPGLLLQPL